MAVGKGMAAVAMAVVLALFAGFSYFPDIGCDVSHGDFPGHVTA